MGADIVNQAMSMGSMIQMAMESLVSPTITAVTTALFTAMFVGRKTEQKGLAGTKTTIFEEEIRTLLDNGRLSYREFNQIKNYLEVAEKADEFHKECGYDKVEPNTQYDIDWFIRFFDAASNVSNEDLQKIWAKLLAGETICKGCFSLRAIETLYNMSPDEARLFSEIADIVIDGRYIFYEMGSIGEEINKKYGETIFTLDIYGQIDSMQTEWFELLQSRFSKDISYKGLVPFDKSTDILKNYYALLFPTRFYTEGIPGTIIDAYASGVPVISAKWESFNDLVNEKIVGYGYTFGNYNELIKCLSIAMENSYKWNQMKKNCLVQAEKYSARYVLNRLIEKL